MASKPQVQDDMSISEKQPVQTSADGGHLHPASTDCDNGCPATARSPFARMSLLDRFLGVWILLAMALGLILGYFTDTDAALQRGQFVGVSVPIALGLLVMMYPILCKVRYESLHRVLRLRNVWTHMLLSLVLNWIVAPLFMVGLAWAFLPDKADLREGLIMVGIARCIAMVLIWTDLSGGDSEYCAMLVAVNSLLQMALFAPCALLYINIMAKPAKGNVSVSYPLVAKSVGVFLGIPLGAAVLTRLALLPTIGAQRYQNVFLRFVGPWSLIGLLYTIVVLFASQSKNVVENIVSVVRVGAPLIVYFLVIFIATLTLCRVLGRFSTKHDPAAADPESTHPSPITAAETDAHKTARRRKTWSYDKSVVQAFTAASNNFELAIAVAVATYGPGSPQALAATVGPLVEVPVLVGLVWGAMWVRGRWGWE